MKKLKIGIVGFGNWGKKIYQTLKSFSNCEIVAICDKENLKLNEKIIITDDYHDLIKRRLDGVIIATPNETHYEIANKFLLSNINLFVEKPLATSYKEALFLINLAQKKNLNLFTGHILLYHPLTWQFKKYLKKFKDNLRLKIIRTNNFLTHKDSKKILYDFAPHDISLILFLLEKDFDNFKKKLEINKGLINFDFLIEERIQISGEWGENPLGKERIVMVELDGKKIVFDDNLTILKFMENKKERFVQKIDRKLPLYWELKFFLNSLINKKIREFIPTEKVMKIIDELEKLL
ncbi:MAG: Gfo/Idh/MocA family oxidoreductase [candidate division WOR-3 bacterium]|nr:Gfo/Idh/MocA family oxidoreductase [candidate division WOR-3 bacterium]MCX7836705.1 Gfo/Idh/MocA family oxidoreductase [candidate division WOR-3 bacterium]MDW8113458.1 Gfo/Idh/MocA family oxidoreductase [candidate division WOR-3 bacterium]